MCLGQTARIFWSFSDPFDEFIVQQLLINFILFQIEIWMKYYSEIFIFSVIHSSFLSLCSWTGDIICVIFREGTADFCVVTSPWNLSIHSEKMFDSTAESWIYSLLLRISKWIENYFIELEIWDSAAIKRFSLTRSKNRFISTPPHAHNLL